MIQTHLLVALIAAVLGFGSAWRVQDWRQAAAEKDRIEAEHQIAKLKAEQADVAARMHEADRAADRSAFRVIYKDVEKVVEKPVYRDRECLGDDGLRVISDAIAGRSGGAASEPAPAVR